MCKYTIPLNIKIPDRFYTAGKKRYRTCRIDSCIHSIIKALNDDDIVTIWSCCGHGHTPGTVILADGRSLIITKSWDEGDKIINSYGVDIHGKKR